MHTLISKVETKAKTPFSWLKSLGLRPDAGHGQRRNNTAWRPEPSDDPNRGDWMTKAAFTAAALKQGYSKVEKSKPTPGGTIHLVFQHPDWGGLVAFEWNRDTVSHVAVRPKKK